MPTPTLSLVDRLLAAYERDGTLPMFSGGDHDENDDTDQTDADQRDAEDTDDADVAELGDKGKEALRREREARRKAEADAKDFKARLDKIEAAARKDADAKAKEQGKWQELAEQRETEISTLAGERDGLQAERDALAEYVKADIAAITKAVKDAKDSPAAKALLDFYPGDDAEPTTLLAWAGKAKTRLGEIDKQSPRGSGHDPAPRGRTDIDMSKETARTKRAIRF